MRRIVLLLMLLAPVAAAQNVPCGTTLPCTLGWTQIPNSNIAPLCPSYTDVQGASGCKGIYQEWGSAWPDTSRSQMLVFGGGHTAYFGNEVYKIDLTANPISITLAKDATHGANLTAPGSCSNANADGTPDSRHDNDGMVYLPAPFDYYFIHGGNLANCGSFTNNYWKLTPGLAWTNFSVPSPSPTPASDGSGTSAAYDPVTQQIYMAQPNSGSTYWRWNPATNTWQNLNAPHLCDDGSPAGYDHTAAIDPIRRLYFCVGAGTAWKAQLDSPFTATKINWTGCGTTKADAGPGLAYYAPDQTIVAWSGGNSVYEYNPDTDSCSTITFSGGPGATQSTGTYKRFAYFPGAGGFLLSPDYNINAFFLRIKDQATENFLYRANQPGVLNSEGFDTTASFAQPASGAMTGMFFATDSTCPTFPTPCIVRDTTNFASGGSSMQVKIPPLITQDGSDYYYARFGCAYGATCTTPTKFGQNSTFYIQFAFRADSNWITTNWPSFGNGQDTAPKLMIVHPSDVNGQPNTCTGTQTVLSDEHGWAIPTGYISCGANNLYVSQAQDGQANQGSAISYQGGWTAPAPFTGYQCNYNSGNRPTVPNCFVFQANTWYTIYYKITLGTISAGNAPITVEAYVGPYGQQLKKFINVLTNLTIPLDTNLSQFDALTLTQFMTGKTASNNPAANAWYDELIVSTAPICPSGGVSPDGLTVCPGVASQGSSIVSQPTSNPPAGTYSAAQNVTLSSATGGATICYTTDGSTPTANGAGTCTHGTTYSIAIPVSSNLTLKAIGSETGLTDSTVLSAVYLIASPATAVISGVAVQSGTVIIH